MKHWLPSDPWTLTLFIALFFLILFMLLFKIRPLSSSLAEGFAAMMDTHNTSEIGSSTK
jgi:hypothetical protein